MDPVSITLSIAGVAIGLVALAVGLQALRISARARQVHRLQTSLDGVARSLEAAGLASVTWGEDGHVADVHQLEIHDAAHAHEAAQVTVQPGPVTEEARGVDEVRVHKQ